MKKQRYLATVQMYIYADNEKDAVAECDKFTKKLDLDYDNKATAINLNKADFGRPVNPVNILKMEL